MRSRGEGVGARGRDKMGTRGRGGAPSTNLDVVVCYIDDVLFTFAVKEMEIYLFETGVELMAAH